MKYFMVILLAALTLASCNRTGTSDANSNEPKIFEKMSASQTGIDFYNKIENTVEINIFSYRNFYNGGGVAIGDINNDGLSDVYMTNNLGDNKLYLNKGDFKFEDITESAGVAGKKGWSTGVVFVDINNDDLLDIYVCRAGFRLGVEEYYTKEAMKNELFINNGDNTFSEKAAEYNLDQNGYTTHAAFFDYDQDGDLDAYILNNSIVQPNNIQYMQKRDLYDEEWEMKDFVKGGGDKLLRNDNGKFVDVSKEANIYGSLIGLGLGVTIGDVNGDHWLDIYVSNDFFEHDYLYINQKDGTFKEEIGKWIGHQSLSSMGTDMADINNDGYPEIFATEMLPDDEYKLKTNTNFDTYNNYLMKLRRDFKHQYMQNTLQFNNKDESFSEIAFYSGVAASDWSWGALMFDADNDGYRDIYVCNGIYQDVVDRDFLNFFANDEVRRQVQGNQEQLNSVIKEMPSNPVRNKLFKNNNKDLTFTDVAASWGMNEKSFSNGAAYGDLDNDGDLDLIVNNVNQESFVYRNNTNEVLKNHYLTIELKGNDKNTKAVGSKVVVHKDGEKLSAELIPSRGFQSSVDYKMVFGLGNSERVDKVEIFWFDQTYSVLDNPAIDQIIKLNYNNTSRSAIPSSELIASNSIAESIENPFFQHKEDDYVDFFYEGLTMRMLSKDGPAMAIGDVNGDGKEDIYIGGATNQAPQLYIQTGSTFTPKNVEVFNRSDLYEDVVAEFFDADGDGDLDLIVGSGGNHAKVNDSRLHNRLYINQGDGNFEDSKTFPRSGFNTGVIVPLDYDNDGDLDLFVGNRSLPNNYGVSPLSYLLQNDGKGNFKDVTKTVAPKFQTLGMITDAIWTNVTGDEANELVVVGEWMSPQVFAFQNGKLEASTSNLSEYSGWWYAIEADDIDGDGDLDLILGNRGENFYFSGSKEAPAKLFVSDFDGNKTFEKIITRNINGKDMPIAMKNELTGQIVSLKKKNLMNVQYAKKSIQDLFPASVLNKSIKRESNYFKSAVAINNGNGQFEVTALPMEVQLSCVCDIYCTDLNGDNKKDLILAGNDSGFLPQFSRLDASFGHVLMNKGDGKYQRLENVSTGFTLKGDVKKIAPLTINNEKHIITAVNNDKPKLFKLK